MKVSGSKPSAPKSNESDSKKNEGPKKEEPKSGSGAAEKADKADKADKGKRDSGAAESAGARPDEKAKANSATDSAEQARKDDEASRAQAEQTRRDEERKASERASLEAKSQTLQAINRGTSDYKANGVEDSAPVDLKGGVAPQSVEQQRADAEKRAQMNQALEQTEPGRAALDQMRTHGVQPELGAGKESYWDGERMVVGRDQSPEEASESVIHETNHMVADKTGTTPDPTRLSRDEYVQGMLREEADGTAQALEARRELQARGATLDGPAPDLEQPYRSAYDSALTAQQESGVGIEEAQAAARGAGRDAVLKAYQDGSVTTSVNGQSYSDYYGKAWDDVQANRVAPSSVVRPDADPNSAGAPQNRIALNDNIGYHIPAAGDPEPVRAAKLHDLQTALTQDHDNQVKDIRLTVEVDLQNQQLKRPGAGEGEGVLTPADVANAVAEAKEKGITLLVDLRPIPDTVRAMNGNDAEGARRYAELSAGVAKEVHDRGLTANYELGNEPNTNSHWPNGGDRDPARMDQIASQYMTYEKAAYNAVKSAQGLARGPDGKYPPVEENGSHVMMAGLSHVDTDILDRLYKNDLANNTDVINMHPYNSGSTPADFVNNMERIRSVMLEHGDTQHKLWLTEIGTERSDTNPTAQQDAMDAAMASMPNYVEKMYWFNKVDVGTPGQRNTSDDGAFGLTELDGSARPSWSHLGTHVAADDAPANVRQRPIATDSALSTTYSQYAPVLGNATGQARPDEANPRKITQQFQNGSISYDPDTGAYEVNTRLGHPTSAHYNGEDGYTVNFEGGSMTYHKESGRYDVTPSAGDPRGGTYDPFADARANNTTLGAPRGAAFYEPNGNLKQLYENGYIVAAPGNAPEVNVTRPPPEP